MRTASGPADLGGDQVEGLHAVHELLASGKRRVRALWVAQDLAGHEPLLGTVMLARRQQVPVQLKSSEALASAARTAAPQGVVAWAQPVQAFSLAELLAAEVPGAGGTGAEGTGPPAFLVVLDGVTDPGNFGSLLRTAACAGATGVVIARHRSAPLTPAALKSAAGAVEKVPIAVVAGIPAALQQLAKAGVWTVGLDPAGPADLWQTSLLDAPVALVLGSEGTGISHLARQRCDVLARIPQSRALESLNVAAAGAVACFEVARQRRAREGGASPAATGPATARASVAPRGRKSPGNQPGRRRSGA
jgi:23S rRNA (guanosine2251-2'-O)-methyltransferase